MNSLTNNQVAPGKSKNGHGGYRKGAGRKPGQLTEARKAQLKAEATLKELAAQHTPEAVETLVALFQDKETPAAARVAAIKEILDRGHGKPPQALTGEGGGPIQSETVIKQVIVDPQEYDA